MVRPATLIEGTGVIADQKPAARCSMAAGWPWLGPRAGRRAQAQVQADFQAGEADDLCTQRPSYLSGWPEKVQTADRQQRSVQR